MVPVVCGLCGDERAVPVYTAAKEDFTGFCVRYGNSGQQSWRWKGGRKRNRDGYIMVKLPHYHPFYSMANKDGYVMEHRLVVAEHLGRPLLDNEIVHHLNRIRDDNRLENLQLLVEHHPGYLPLSSDEQD
jgi:hypothetical protein